MKTYHLLFLTVFLAIGCQKDEPSTAGTGSTNTGGLSTVPATFTQKYCWNASPAPVNPNVRMALLKWKVSWLQIPQRRFR
ncbi:MAG: hypothetical protein IPP46_15915 [Bacteroidetes bacterium]|nr:hypothetical protein [Bacteroidota bacterium]